MENFGEFNSASIEKEKEIDLKKIKVFRVRHGNSEYREVMKNTIEDDELDLTEKGILELEQTAEHLTKILSSKTDIVVVASSERRRAISSSNIIKNRLIAAGFIIWNDPVTKNGRNPRTVLKRINDMEIINEESGKIIPPLTETYWDASGDIWAEYTKEGATISPKDAYSMWRDKKIERLSGDRHESESMQDIDNRSTNQLALLIKIANKFQPGLASEGKRLVIIEVEHDESLDGFTEKTGAEKSIRHGGFFELDIPVNANEISIKVWNIGEVEKNVGTISFDAKSRKFI